MATLRTGARVIVRRSLALVALLVCRGPAVLALDAAALDLMSAWGCSRAGSSCRHGDQLSNRR